MDIQLEKRQVMEIIKGTDDLSIILAVKELLTKKKKDWWDDLTDEQKAEIEKGLSELFEYLEGRWSERIKNKFISNLDKVIYLIQIEPEIFPKSELNKNYRKCVLSKQTTIYYKYNTKRVEIITFFDTRQNPNKIKKDIK